MGPTFGFGVGPVGAAVGIAALNVMHDEELCARSARLGAVALERLRGLDSPHVRSVRGCGLLIGVEIDPESGPARTFCEALLERGVLCRDAQSQVIRLVLPLTIDEDDWDYALSVIAEVLG
jgi:ornithine--oxo-acid transaminase